MTKYMYVFNRQVTMQRGIATLLVMALVLWAVGAQMFTRQAEAANLTYVSDTLSNSAPGVASNHTIQFLSPTGVSAGQTIVVTFPLGFNISTSSVAVGDIDLAVAGVDQTLVAAGATAAQWNVPAPVGQTLTFTSGGAGAVVGSNATVTIKIGKNAVGGTNQVTNPTSITSYMFDITAGLADEAQTRVAIVNNVLVTAQVDSTLVFAVNGLPIGSNVNNSATTTSTTTTSSALPFGLLAPNASKTLGQNLTVATNAIHGYVVTVQESSLLQSSTGAVIDNYIDADNTQVPTAWTHPSNNVTLPNTWGHWGLTSTDGTTTRASQFTADKWVAPSTTPIVVMGHTGPADGTTSGIGSSTIGYQIEITPLQEAGNDYTTTLTYIATPTF